MGKIILRGIPVSRGVASGKVKIIKNYRQVEQVEEGDILVIPDGHPRYAIGAMKASGLICEVGGRLSHICIVAVEMGIPCITQAVEAMNLLQNRDTVVMDANEGVVYEAEK